MFKLLQSLFGKKSVEVKQPEFHEEIRAQVEAGKVNVEVKEGQPQFNSAYDPVSNKKPAGKAKSVKNKKAPANSKTDAKKAPAKATAKPAPKKSKKQ